MPQLPEQRYSEQWETAERTRFDLLITRNLSELLRESSKEYNFLEIKPQVEYVIEQITLLAENYAFWERLSDPKRRSVNDSLNEMVTQFDSMSTFDPKQNNAWDNRNNIVQNFKSRYGQFYDNIVSPLSAYLGQRAFSKELSSRFGKEAQAELNEIRRIKTEIEATQSQVKEAASIAGNVASSAHSADFAHQADVHWTSAQNWLRATIGGGVITALVGLTVIIDIGRELTNSKFSVSAEAYVVKFALLAFLYFGLRFTIRNYSAHQHLDVVNMQRANVLKSMEAFRTSAISEGAKDAVLLAAVGAAYAQQETGFITTKEGAGSDDGDIMSIVETALKNK